MRGAAGSSVLERVAAACREGITDARVDGAGVTMLAGSGTRLPVWSSDGVSAEVEDLQVTLGQGPCVDAIASGSPVLVGDLTGPLVGPAQGWPLFHDEALRVGVRAIFAFPLVLGSVALGSLDLYRRTPGALGDVELSRSVSTAEALSETLVDQDSLSLADEHLGSQMAVHRAAGIVTVQLDCTIDEALDRLRAAAYADGVTVHRIAADVEAGRRHFSREER